MLQGSVFDPAMAQRFHAAAVHRLQPDVSGAQPYETERHLPDQTLLHHPTDVETVEHFDHVVCAVAALPADDLWKGLRGSAFEVHRKGRRVAVGF